jgi:hypothetical protein
MEDSSMVARTEPGSNASVSIVIFGRKFGLRASANAGTRIEVNVDPEKHEPSICGSRACDSNVNVSIVQLENHEQRTNRIDCGMQIKSNEH